MTVYTFEIQWPAPFKQGWQRSSKRFHTADKAGEALGAFLAVSLDNDVKMEGRLVALPNV